jgi:hypothetical protein
MQAFGIGLSKLKKMQANQTLLATAGSRLS